MLCNTSGNGIDERAQLSEASLNKAAENGRQLAEQEQNKVESSSTREASCHNGVCQIIWKPHRA
jgi:hypothetical protein